MKNLLEQLRAVAEVTRLRILVLLESNELTVGELTRILGQSQPRVSRHLKLLCSAGLLERFQEGTWVFYRASEDEQSRELVESLLRLVPADDVERLRDQQQLELIKQEQSQQAMAYFQKNAKGWNRIRKLHIDESAIERVMLEIAQPLDIRDMVDLGTGTGRILEVFSTHVKSGLGVDINMEMLSLARDRLKSVGIVNCQVRKGDIYSLNLPSGCADVVTIHHVLHFLDDPARVVKEAARLLRSKGRLLIVDFAPHDLEFLRTEFSHRRLGFCDNDVTGWCKQAGLSDVAVKYLAPNSDHQQQLTVGVWCAVQNNSVSSYHKLRVA